MVTNGELKNASLKNVDFKYGDILEMKVNRITQRWFVNNFVVILITLIIIEIFVALGIKSFYYNSVEKSIKSQSLAVLDLIDKSYNNCFYNIDSEIRSIIENFTLRDKMEMMFLNQDGKVVITSTGFKPTEDLIMPDYNIIKSMNENVAVQKYAQTVYLLNDENVMSVIYPIEKPLKDFSYVRFVTSITNVDQQVVIIIAITTLICICIIFFVVVSSSYFIQSIVVPVDEISKTAQKIAHGDFAIRLDKKTDDEIGDLCEIINYMAEELSVTEKMKNEFISSISHELRTPLTAIKGWAETVNACSASDGEIIKKGMKVIISETDRLSFMVEELLDFSRLQNGNTKLNLTLLDIVAEVEDVIIIFEERAKQEGIILMSQLPDECIMVNGDKNRLKQVFTNIIDNALKYSESGKEVSVICTKNSGFAIIKIIDNGCGINPKDLPKIKNKFYKANYSKRGSGIGLAVADEMIRLHGGSLDVYSVDGKGTTVVIQIPIAE